MADSVVDASAVLALLGGESGAERVSMALPTAVISAANHAEVISKLIEKGLPMPLAISSAADLALEIAALDAAAAIRVGAMHAVTRGRGISLGDRACLALGEQLGLPVLTADRAWAELDLGIEVVLIR
jgi:ribonuclease VapC